MEVTNELKVLKSELDRINNIQPDDNLRFLINQIQVGNITTSDDKRVLNILNEVRLGMVSKQDKYNELQWKMKNLNK